MPHSALAVALVLCLLATAGAPPASAPAAPPTREVEVVFAVVARDAGEGERAAARLAPQIDALLQDFARATGGRVTMRVAGAPLVLTAPEGVAALDERPAAWTRAVLAAGARPDLVALLAADLPVAGEACACVAWARPAREHTAEGALDRSHLFGAPPGFLGVVALGGSDVLDDPIELRFRFLHEAGHAWCCRGRAGADGAHWPASPENDPLAHGASRAGPWRYSASTLDAL